MRVRVREISRDMLLAYDIRLPWEVQGAPRGLFNYGIVLYTYVYEFLAIDVNLN